MFSPNTGKYGPEKTPYLDTFHAVLLLTFTMFHTLFCVPVDFTNVFVCWKEKGLGNANTNSKWYWLKTFYTETNIAIIPLVLLNDYPISNFKAKANLFLFFDQFLKLNCTPVKFTKNSSNLVINLVYHWYETA